MLIYLLALDINQIKDNFFLKVKPFILQYKVEILGFESWDFLPIFPREEKVKSMAGEKTVVNLFK